MTTETWVPLVTFVMGYVGRSISEWVQDRRLMTRERNCVRPRRKRWRSGCGRCRAAWNG